MKHEHTLDDMTSALFMHLDQAEYLDEDLVPQLKQEVRPLTNPCKHTDD